MFYTQWTIENEDRFYHDCLRINLYTECQPHYSSLKEIINEIFEYCRYVVTSLTFNISLECNRGSPLICLDWTDICNGVIDCLNDGIDEKVCWILEMNKCQSDEYRCTNGQCIL